MHRSQTLHLVSKDYDHERRRAARLAALEARHAAERAKERRDHCIFLAIVGVTYALAVYGAIEIGKWIIR